MAENFIVYRKIIFDSDDYAQTLLLRHEVLRRPWGKSIAEDDLSGERDDLIYGAFDGLSLVGMAILQDRGEPYDKLRFMAVNEDYRGQRIGATIAKELESRARRASKKGIRLAARTSVIPFYEKLGYVIDGERFIPDHIPVEHIHMVLDF
ncbi:MAG: GNAT family N-acetyltransferase [Clostridiaceae bacterium]|jgi:predicted GNAT family N-acyltransferase|nr:GNAT family N-acetyltransferase [Clostridiaceae bacterium]